ncbi:MAG: ArnT family glycosyltransferase [Bacteriovoracia bacterium]
MQKKDSIHPLLLLSLFTISFTLFTSHFPLFDWDEVNFAEVAREMLLTGDYFKVQIDFRPFFEKPPLFFLMQAATMKALGVTEFAARIPNAICGLFTLVLLFFAGKKIRSTSFGFNWALLYACSFLPHVFFKTGLIDPWFNFFIFSALILFFFDSVGKVLAVLPLILATMTKGPVGVGLFTITYALFLLNKKFVNRKHSIRKEGFSLVFVSLITLCICSIWYFSQMPQSDPGRSTLFEFIRYQIRLLLTHDAGHGGFFFYHFVVLLIGCFPASFLCLPSIKEIFYDLRKRKTFSFDSLMFFLLTTVLVIFSIVQTKIIHYSSLAYFPITYLGARFLQKKQNDHSSSIWQTSIIYSIVVAILILFLPILLRFLSTHSFQTSNPYITGLLTSPFSTWRWYDGWPSFFLFGGVFLFLYTARFEYFLVFCHFFVTAMFVSFVPKAFLQTQGPLIEFYKTHAKEDVYFEPLDHKSFAHLFYTKSKPLYPEHNKDFSKGFKDGMSKRVWLLYDPFIDRPAYFTAKASSTDLFNQFSQLQKIGEKGGYVFLIRYKRISN